MAPKEENKYDYGAININKDELVTSEWNNGTEFEVKHGDDGDIDNVNNETKKLWFLKRSSSTYIVGGLIALLFIIYRLFIMPHDVIKHNPFHKGGNGDDKSSSTIPLVPSTSSGDSSNMSIYNKFLSTSPKEMGFHSIQRDDGISPSKIFDNFVTGPFPTNSWYLNLVSHRAAAGPDDSTSVYTVPYIIDTAAHSATKDVTAGIRIHWPVLQSNDSNMQMVDDYKNSLVVGTTEVTFEDKTYHVSNDKPLSPLGVSLEWGGDSTSNNKKMTTHIVRGMPYATTTYEGGILPTLFSYNGLSKESNQTILIDNNNDNTSGTKLKCGLQDKDGNIGKVEKNIQVHFLNSDFTWIIFFNQPVYVKCHMSNGDEYTRQFSLNVVDKDDKSNDKKPLVVRASILDQCTTGHSNIHLHCTTSKRHTAASKKKYAQLLRDYSNIYPTNPQINFIYPNVTTTTTTTTNATSTSSDQKAQMIIDWGVENSSGKEDTSSNNNTSLLMYALPHHQEFLSVNDDKYVDDTIITNQCVHSFHGQTCLVKSNVWNLSIDVGEEMSFTARRPPSADSIPVLVNALKNDIQYTMPNNLLRGAADTYFSGKILGRVARIVVIAKELQTLASSSTGSFEEIKATLHYNDVDDETLQHTIDAVTLITDTLPTNEEIDILIDNLKHVVSTWLSKKAEAPFVYDESWGGFVNCGCHYVGYNDHGYCNNTFPNCPALSDVNEDFGNGFYNDHHYHYGYHMLAAAVAAKYDPIWGIEQFDKIMLYVRDFANPFNTDIYFPQFRQKDWFLGSSWASGIVSGENSPHGRNEESSSEAISAYEAVTLFGSVMVDAFAHNITTSTTTYNDELKDKLEIAKLVQQSGQFLTATELHATNRYWHVWSSDTHNNTYPFSYKQPVVGMLYDTMASFQTWFAPQAVVSYGIQLLPLTPVAEERDDVEWAQILYPIYEQSCKTAGKFCIDNGWSILQAGLLATAGDQQQALDQALAIPTKVFSSDGGEGNSLTNTIWFISTRKKVENFSSTNVEPTTTTMN